ncbi:hypothetical protein HanHA300_Chr02g0047371 [Helianthus annuus]|nr:hypothetical protein HanHA300_Chr02g0047371 [Helianthus annuus]KAJ0618248.1 hypothetical protein HanHA89_Chr02g0051001 [Helianthus annuus]KAJ0776710.1 hypothetical protein HanLR1_Chr02g0048761 [Helianthus annuus]
MSISSTLPIRSSTALAHRFEAAANQPIANPLYGRRCRLGLSFPPLLVGVFVRLKTSYSCGTVLVHRIFANWFGCPTGNG